MRAGKLRHYVDLQSPTQTVGAMGGLTVSYAHDSYSWASIQPQAGSEAVKAGQAQAKDSVLITIRYHATVKPTWKIVNGSKTYEVNAIINIDERNREMQLSCTEVPTI